VKTTTKRVIWGFVVAFIAVAIYANLRWSSDWPPRADLEFRIVSKVACDNCLRMEQATGPNEKAFVYLEPPLATSADIRSISANVKHDPVINFKFRRQAVERIRDVTSRNTGHEIALLAGGKVLEISTLSAPFSDSMQMNGLSLDEHQRIFFSVVKSSRSATSHTDQNR
jgi:preprotein translocase subunit SecD